MEKIRVKPDVIRQFKELPGHLKMICVALDCDERTAETYLEKNSILLTCLGVIALLTRELKIPTHLLTEREYPAPIREKKSKK